MLVLHLGGEVVLGWNYDNCLVLIIVKCNWGEQLLYKISDELRWQDGEGKKTISLQFGFCLCLQEIELCSNSSLGKGIYHNNSQENILKIPVVNIYPVKAISKYQALEVLIFKWNTSWSSEKKNK